MQDTGKQKDKCNCSRQGEIPAFFGGTYHKVRMHDHTREILVVCVNSFPFINRVVLCWKQKMANKKEE